MSFADIKHSLRSNIHLAANLVLERVPGVVKQPLLAGLGRLPYEKKLPSFIMIEPTNACNLHCPLCPVGAKVMQRKRGFIDVEKYKELVDEIAPFVKQINMNFAGEPLLHPNIGTLIAYAEERGVAVTIGTNGMIDKMQEVLDAGTTEVLYAIDGLTDETLTRYRRGAKLDVVKANLRKLIEGRRGRTKPNIVLQFVVMKHNEHEIDGLIELARAYGVDEVSLTPVCINDFFAEKKRALIEEYLPQNSRFRQYQIRGDKAIERKPDLCSWVFQSLILYNGDVSICCFDYDGEAIVGNAFTDGGFVKVWKSEKYRKMRSEILQRKVPLCQRCDFSYVKPFHFSVEGESLGRRR